MIYCTIGTMYLDFRRLIEAVDCLAGTTGEEIIVQKGCSETPTYNVNAFDFKPHDEIVAIQKSARVIVAHAGIGALLDALQARRPFIMVPRLRKYNEHTNDHQRDIGWIVEKRGWGRTLLNIDDLPAACADPVPFPAHYRPDSARLVSAVRRMVARTASRKKEA
jgi:beta-1,4-N-acetylglucosaminyltransferase